MLVVTIGVMVYFGLMIFWPALSASDDFNHTITSMGENDVAQAVLILTRDAMHASSFGEARTLTLRFTFHVAGDALAWHLHGRHRAFNGDSIVLKKSAWAWRHAGSIH